jgi:hypothetical protein
MLFVLTLVGGKLIELQGLDRTAYAQMAAKQRLHTVTITAPRGTRRRSTPATCTPTRGTSSTRRRPPTGSRRCWR